MLTYVNVTFEFRW